MIDEQQSQKALQILKDRLDRRLTTYLEVCGRCGLCAEACHYYVSDPKPEHTANYRNDQLRRIYRKQYDWVGRVFPAWVGARDLDEEMVDTLVEAAFGTCTMCRRCSLNCMMGVDVGALMRTTRGMLASLGRVPQGLQDTVDIHLETGNNMGVSEVDFIETLEWMEEELQNELNDPTVKIPINKKGARVVYTFNPREVKYYPLSIQSAAKIFHAVGEDWTVSTEGWDVTNYALFSGDDKAARTIARRLVDAVEKIGARWLIMAECGHGFRALRWEGENWLGRQVPFWIRGFVPVIAEYIQDGRLHLDPSKNPKTVTYHDPCNQARNGGIVDEPRFILAHAVENFVEMHPNGIYNYCCGGGGGMLSMTEYSKRRIEVGKVKAEQIASTGAEILATSCHNCLDQLGEIRKHYGVKVKVLNLSDLVADAIVWPQKSKTDKLEKEQVDQ